MATARLTRARIAFVLASEARTQARRATESKAIRAAMKITVLDFGLVTVEVPFYWAVYYHDGRGPVRARPGHKIVYFKDPNDDPRINGAARNYPVRAAQIRRLSKKQFYRFLKSGKLVAVDKVGSAEAHPFFTEGLRNFKNRISGRPGGHFSSHVLEELDSIGFLNKSVSGKIRLR